jgi:hypothetical protein
VNIAILPRDVSTNMTVEIPFATAVAESESGFSGRKSTRDIPLRLYTMTINPDNSFEAMKICLAMRGARWPLAIRDWANNYVLTDEAQTLDNTSGYYGGGQTAYNLHRKFTPATGTRTYTQRILMIDQTEVAFTVKVNGTPLTGSPSLWHINDPGILVIDESLSGSDTVTVSGQYLVPVVFSDDSLVINVRTKDLLSIDAVRLREIGEQELIALTT